MRVLSTSTIVEVKGGAYSMHYKQNFKSPVSNGISDQRGTLFDIVHRK